MKDISFNFLFYFTILFILCVISFQEKKYNHQIYMWQKANNNSNKLQLNQLIARWTKEKISKGENFNLYNN